MSQNAWRTIQRLLVYGVRAGWLLVLLILVLYIGLLLMDPFPRFEGHSEFTDLSGAAAKRRLSDAWPGAVDAGAVKSVSYESDSSRDSFSTWYRIQLTPGAARVWMDHIHNGQESDPRQYLSHLHEGFEGVHRTVPGPLHVQVGKTLTWWTPPGIDFRATEVMLWYKGYDSGVALATYSAFDESTGILWIHEYSEQHEILWAPGSVPSGNVFSTIDN